MITLSYSICDMFAGIHAFFQVDIDLPPDDNLDGV